MNPRQYARCLGGIVAREGLRFLRQRERFFGALVRPLVWLFIFAAGFRSVLGVSIIPPYQTYILYEEYIVPGLAAMILLFSGMQSSLSMVYDREMGSMRMLMVSPFPRWYLLLCKLVAGALVSIAQVYLFLLIAWFWEVEPPWIGYLLAFPALLLSSLMLGAFGPVALLRDQAAREFRRGDELCDLSHVFRLVGVVPVMAYSRLQCPIVRNLPVQSLYPRCGADTLFPIRGSKLGGLGGGTGSARVVSRGRHHRLRSGARVDGAQAGSMTYPAPARFVD